MVAFFSPALPYVVPTTMIDVIKHLGLTSGLKLCLDAGDVNSVASGTQDKWIDTSGNGYDFFRGSGTGSDAADPTFNGVVGRQSSGDYWGFDGGDYFTLGQANPTWVQNLHKDSAVWAFAVWAYIPSLPSAAAVLFGTGNSGLDSGVTVFVTTGGILRLGVFNALGPPNGLVISGTQTVTTGAWNFLAGQVSEAAGTGFLQVNATQEDMTTTYNSPSSGSATEVLEIGRDGVGSAAGPLPNAYRVASVSMWGGTAPSKAQVESLRLLTKSKFGL